MSMLINPYKVQPPASGPALPAFSNVALVVGLNNYNPGTATTSFGATGGSDSGSGDFTAITPYPVDYPPFVDFAGSPPYALDSWVDQNFAFGSPANSLNASGAARPTLDADNRWIVFDGAASCLQSFSSVILGTAATAYLRFKTTNLASTEILYEIGATPTATPFALSVRTVAGVLTVTVTDSTGLLFNTKTYSLSNDTWYIITVIVDTTLSAANQVKVLVNNSTSGVSAPVSTDLASGNLADGVLNVGARNQASSFLAGSMTDLLLFSVAHNSGTATSWRDYISYVHQ